MIEGIGNEISKMIGCFLMLVIAAIVIVGVVLFCIGRCSASSDIHLRSPITVEKKS